MAFFKDFIYPFLVDKLGNPPPIQEARRQLIPLAYGNVLEIGAGSGANFIHYDASRVKMLYALEPNDGMIRLARKRERQIALNIEYLDLPGERIPSQDGSIDTVVSTFTLCTIPGIRNAIQGIARVIKPEGQLIFYELGLAPDPGVQRWQMRLEPLSMWLFQGLYLTRDIPSLIKEGGFRMEQIEKGYLAEFPKSLSYCWWGIALPPSRRVGLRRHR